MNLNDFFMSEAVYCFYSYYLDSVETGSFIKMDGQLKTFQIGDRVPWRSFLYNYTEDFSIVDYRKENPVVHIINNGIYTQDITLELCRDSDFTKCIVDTTGNRIKVNSMEELKECNRIFLLEWKRYSRKHKGLFPNGITRARIDNPTDYLEKKQIKEIYYHSTVGAFIHKFIARRDSFLKPETYTLAMFLSCYFESLNRASVYMEQTLAETQLFFNVFSNFLNAIDLPVVLLEYEKWLKDEELISFSKLENMLYSIKELGYNACL